MIAAYFISGTSVLKLVAFISGERADSRTRTNLTILRGREKEENAVGKLVVIKIDQRTRFNEKIE